MTNATAARTNRYAGTCDDCGQHIPASTGRLVKAADGWIVRCADDTTCTTTQAAATASEVTEEQRQAMIMAEGARRQAETGVEPSFFDVAADIDAQLRAEGRLPGQSRQEPVAAPRRRSTSPRRGSTVRRTTPRRRKACVTGGNCSSHSGYNCGGAGCDAN